MQVYECTLKYVIRGFCIVDLSWWIIAFSTVKLKKKTQNSIINSNDTQVNQNFIRKTCNLLNIRPPISIETNMPQLVSSLSRLGGRSSGGGQYGPVVPLATSPPQHQDTAQQHNLSLRSGLRWCGKSLALYLAWLPPPGRLHNQVRVRGNQRPAAASVDRRSIDRDRYCQLSRLLCQVRLIRADCENRVWDPKAFRELC